MSAKKKAEPVDTEKRERIKLLLRAETHRQLDHVETDDLKEVLAQIDGDMDLIEFGLVSLKIERTIAFLRIMEIVEAEQINDLMAKLPYMKDLVVSINAILAEQPEVKPEWHNLTMEQAIARLSQGGA